MKIALAQIHPVKGDIKENIRVHKEMIALASDAHADALFFSELSITGYEPELAEELSFEIEDDRLDSIEKLSQDLDMIIGVGAPQRTQNGMQISMFIFTPTKKEHHTPNKYFTTMKKGFSSMGIIKRSLIKKKLELHQPFVTKAFKRHTLRKYNNLGLPFTLPVWLSPKME